jgi:hypothetical protein
MDRRKFLKLAFGASVAAVAAPIIGAKKYLKGFYGLKPMPMPKADLKDDFRDGREVRNGRARIRIKQNAVVRYFCHMEMLDDDLISVHHVMPGKKALLMQIRGKHVRGRAGPFNWGVKAGDEFYILQPRGYVEIVGTYT